MNVFYNAYVLNKPITGVGRYLQAISYISSNYNKIALTPNAKIYWSNNFSNIYHKDLKTKIGKLFWNFFHPIFIKSKIDIYHSPFPSLPFLLPKSCKKIITVHDLIFLNTSKDYRVIEYIFMRFSFYNALKRADTIICVSEYTKKSLLNRYPFVKNKTKVVINSAIKNYSLNEINCSDKKLSNLLNSKNKYFVLPSNRHPRKNIKNTITAFCNSKYYKNNYKLVLCGLDESIKKNQYDNIIDISYLSDIDYHILLKNSNGLFYFSYDEGFGYPITEAMDFNISIFCSNIPSSIEIFDNDARFLCADLSSNGIQEYLDSFYDDNSKLENFLNLMQSKKYKFNFNTFENSMKEIYYNIK